MRGMTDMTGWTRKQKITTVAVWIMGWIALALAVMAWLVLAVLWTEPSVGFLPVLLIDAILFSAIAGFALRRTLRAWVIRHRPRPWVLRLAGSARSRYIIAVAVILLLVVLVVGFVLVFRSESVGATVGDYAAAAYAPLSVNPLDSREVEGQTSAPDVSAYFSPVSNGQLKEIPIYKSRRVLTAMTYNSTYVPHGYEFVAVNANWGNPDLFPEIFQTSLMVHEYLHILEPLFGIDLPAFASTVRDWYLDPATGDPHPVRSEGGNYVKYTLRYNLYDEGTRHYPEDRVLGVEEFAYIGEAIAWGEGHYLPESIIDYYDGILSTLALDGETRIGEYTKGE